jgi:hypothetical protein
VIGLPVFPFQILAVPSNEPVANSVPSGLKATTDTPSRCRILSPHASPVIGSQRRAELSREAVATRTGAEESGLKITVAIS